MNENRDRPPGEGTQSTNAPDPQFTKDFEKTILSYAQAVNEDKPEEAQKAMVEAFLMVGEEARRNPSPSIQLRQKAAEMVEQGDWAEAESAHRQVLALEEASGQLALVAKAQADLCGFLRLLGRLDEAWQVACQAVESARRAEMFPVLVMALEAKAYCALERGEHQEVRAAVEETRRIIEPGKLYDAMRTRSTLLQARCSLAEDDLESADAALNAGGEEINAPSAFGCMPGPLSRRASWWETKSLLEEKRGNMQEAREALGLAIDVRRQMGGVYGLAALAKALDRLSALVRRAGDGDEAARAATEAEAIQTSLQLPPKSGAIHG